MRIRLSQIIGLLTAAALVAGGIDMESLLGQTYRLPLVVGAVPHWDIPDAAASVEINSGAVGAVSPWCYGVAHDGSVQSQLLDQPAEHSLVTAVAARGTRLIPTVADVTDGRWAPATVRAILHDPDRRAAHVRALVDLVDQQDLAGLQIDYEDLASGDRQVFSAFIDDLARGLHEKGAVLWVTVHPKVTDEGYDERNRAQDYAAIGRSADAVVVMAYDWRWANSAPGSIAPNWWVARVLGYTTSLIPAHKVILGVGLYGYDWVGDHGTTVVWRQAQALAAHSGAQPRRDDVSGSSMFRYTEQGRTHEVWYEDAASITAKLDLAVAYRLGGVELWRLGSEDPGIWSQLAARSAAA